MSERKTNKTPQSPFVQGLNLEQSKSVLHDDGSLAVIAGAGSGKTRVLTHRIGWLIDERGHLPQNIFAVTFTNKAAKEMKDRLFKLGVKDVNNMWVGTFHGLAYKMLKIHYEKVGLSKYFQIIDAQEQEKLIKKLYKANSWDAKLVDHKTLMNFINAQKDVGNRPFNIKPSNPVDGFCKMAYVEYQEVCDNTNLVDFGELILRSYELFEKNEDIKLAYQEKFTHILVDEFQDTNDIQYSWIKIMSESGQSVPVTVVGDMDQSIYSWRGAKMTNVQKFVDEFASVQMIKLEQNYRSTQNILNCANHLIKNNKQRIPKNLWTSHNDGDPVILYEAQDEKEEAIFAVNQAVKHYKKTNKWSDNAILYRSNAQSRIIEEICIKKNIPYIIYGGIRFFERAEVKDVLAHLTMLIDLDNDLMLERALTSPSKGFGPKALDALRIESISRKVSWNTLLNDDNFTKKNLTAKARTAWSFWKDSWIEQGSSTSSTLEDKMRWCVEKTGLLSFYQELDKKDNTDRAGNLLELISVARRYVEGKSSTGEEIVREFLSSAALESENKHSKDDDAIQLMTIHAAKGLEFPFVCVIGWDDGLFPSARSINDPQSLEEERRLAYVAITRAEKSLYISGAVERRQYGQVLSLPPSRFLKELPQSAVMWARSPTRRGNIVANIARGQSSNNVQRTRNNTSYWNVNDKVSHPSFGDGIIKRVDGMGKNDRVLVRFKNGVDKVLLPQLAKLQKV